MEKAIAEWPACSSRKTAENVDDDENEKEFGREPSMRASWSSITIPERKDLRIDDV
jgi:hypothetical protein